MLSNFSLFPKKNFILLCEETDDDDNLLNNVSDKNKSNIFIIYKLFVFLFNNEKMWKYYVFV